VFLLRTVRTSRKLVVGRGAAAQRRGPGARCRLWFPFTPQYSHCRV